MIIPVAILSNVATGCQSFAQYTNNNFSMLFTKSAGNIRVYSVYCSPYVRF